jgi:hypothetical protein
MKLCGRVHGIIVKTCRKGQVYGLKGTDSERFGILRGPNTQNFINQKNATQRAAGEEIF